MNCQFYNPSRPLCSLGLYGGTPSLKACQDCISKGQNNKPFADALAARYAISHPEGWRNSATVSNCCGRADQA